MAPLREIRQHISLLVCDGIMMARDISKVFCMTAALSSFALGVTGCDNLNPGSDPSFLGRIGTADLYLKEIGGRSYLVVDDDPGTACIEHHPKSKLDNIAHSFSSQLEGKAGDVELYTVEVDGTKYLLSLNYLTNRGHGCDLILIPEGASGDTLAR